MMGMSSMAQDKEPLKVTFPCSHAWCEDEARQDKQFLPIFLNLVVFCTELRPKRSLGEQGLFCLGYPPCSALAPFMPSRPMKGHQHLLPPNSRGLQNPVEILPKGIWVRMSSQRKTFHV